MSRYIVVLLRRTQQTLVMKNGLIPLFGQPPNGPFKPLKMIRQIVGVKWPEVLLVSENIHDLCGSGIFYYLLQGGNGLIEGCFVAGKVHPRKNNAGVKILQHLIPREIDGPCFI